MSQTEVLTAQEAARRLGVKRATLYTYVHRGWLSSLSGADGRSRVYLAEEVEALRARAESTRGHRAVAESALRWGQPSIDTAISSVGPDGPRYRGERLAALLPRGFPAVAEQLIGLPPAPWPATTPLPAAAAALELVATLGEPEALHRRLIGLLARVPLEDPRALIQLAAVACAVSPEAARAALAHSHPAHILATALGRPEAHGTLDAALCICAEHELNASTFAARVAASAGASLPLSLCAALAALSGHRHGALSQQVEALLDDPGQVQAHLRAGKILPGCGHRLYPDGDPRARLLLALAPLPPEVEALRALLEARGHPAPNLDFGLAGLRRALGLPPGSAMAIFAVGRLAGWIAHVREEQARDTLIRPRARYIGPTHRQRR